MPKADVTLPDGTKVVIEGSKEQVADIVKQIAVQKKTTSKTSKETGSGPAANVRGLVDEGFFEQKRSIGEVQSALEERGYIYSTPSLSPVLLRLIRKNGPLRRLKEQDGYKYLNR
jgi:predicted DNA-binding antitoxin AbrB/MazE fold protein